MNARVPEGLLQAVEGLDSRQLARALSCWPQQAGAGATRGAAHWTGVTPSLGVILVDLAQLREAGAELPAVGLQPLDLAQLHTLLGSILHARKATAVAMPVSAETPKPVSSSSHSSALTRRQHDILREAARGKSNIEIAQALHISVDTVKSHMRQILMRLEARNRTELAAMYQRAESSMRARGTN